MPRLDSKSVMLPRLFNRIEATSQTAKFYKPMHLAEHTEKERQRGRECEREREEEQPKLKEWKKNNYAFNIFSFGRNEGRERERGIVSLCCF